MEQSALNRSQAVVNPADRESAVREVTMDGKTVTIEVECSAAGGWLLRIVGSHGQISEWTELFMSSGEAMATGLCAIKYEGIDDFYDDPIFRNLNRAP
jgi:hypothetical protein